MNSILIIGAILLSLVGIIGSVLPALPGAPLNYLALFFLYFIPNADKPSVLAIIIFGLLTAGSLAADYLLPAASAKRYGATTLGIVGAVIGLIVGFVVFNFLGMLVGTFLGAVIGELVAGKEFRQALKAGLAGTAGNILAIVAKLVIAIGMTIYLVIKLF